MPEALWFLAGLAVTAVYAAVMLRRRARSARAQAASASQRHAQIVRELERSCDRLRHRADEQIALVAQRDRQLRRRTEDGRRALARAAQLEAALREFAAAGGTAESRGAAERLAAVDALVDADPTEEATLEPAAGGTDQAAWPVTVEARPLAMTLSHELANIVSGIEGGAFRLIEVAPLPPTRATAAEGLWLAIRRLRRFHDKVRAFVQQPESESTTVSVESLLIGLRDELEASELGLQMAWSLPRMLPMVRGSAEVLQSGLMFLSVALQQLERGALRLSIEIEPSFDHDDAPQVQLELRLEWDEDPGRQPKPQTASPAFLVARTSARNLLCSQGGSVVIDHEPGDIARALVRLPAVHSRASALRSMMDPDRGPPAGDSPQLTASQQSNLPPLRSNRFGGVLVLESDPTVRSMLASELKAAGRAVFACADVAAARSLMQATPDRFEMLIVDQATRLSSGDSLAAVATEMCPSMKFFVLSDGSEGDLPEALAARVHRIRKPFGVHELRRALSTVFDG